MRRGYSTYAIVESMKKLSAIGFLLVSAILASICTGQTLTWKRTGGPPGGSVTCLAVDNTGAFFIGTQNGNVVMTPDNGSTGNLLFSHPGQMAVTSLTLSLTQKLLVGTTAGLYRSNLRPTSRRSTDFQLAAFSGVSSTPYPSIEALATGPDGSIYASVFRGGVHKSVDGGETFFPSSHGLLLSSSFFSILPSTSSKIFAAANYSIYVSYDSGKLWNKTNIDNAFVHQLGVDSQGRIYAGAASYTTSPVGGVFVTTDDGNAWKNIGLPTQYVTAMHVDYSGIILVGTLEGVYRSSDQGASWLKLSGNIANIYATSFTKTSDNSLYMGTRFLGVFRSNDLGSTWDPVNVDASRVRSIASNSKGRFFAVVGEGPEDLFGMSGSALYRSDDASQTWTSCLLPAVNAYSVTGTSDDRLFAATNSGLFTSSDDGVTWSLTSGPAVAGSYAYMSDQRGYIYAGQNRSTDKGITWTSFQVGLPQYTIVTAVAVHPGSSIFLGTSGKFGGSVLISTNDGATWTEKYLPGAGMGAGVNALQVSQQGAVLAATTWGGVLRSQDLGTTWTAASPVGSAIISLFVASNGTIFAGTREGSFSSTDEGTSWTRLDYGPIGNTTISYFAEANTGTIFAGTDGLGVARKMVASPTTTVSTSALSSNYPNPFSTWTSFDVTLQQPNHVLIQIYNIVGQLVGTVKDSDLPSGTFAFDFFSKGMTSGIYFCRVQIGNKWSVQKILLMR